MGNEAVFFPIFHTSALLPIALPSPFKYAQEKLRQTELLVFLSAVLYCDKLFGFTVINFFPKQL